jgi:hypothetical protein
VIAYQLDHGWLMWIPPDPDDHQVDHPMPLAVLTICRYARSRGCDYVLFDADADTIDELPAWEWT